MNLTSQYSRLSRWSLMALLTLGLTLGGLLWHPAAQAIPLAAGTYLFHPDSGLSGFITVAPRGTIIIRLEY